MQLYGLPADAAECSSGGPSVFAEGTCVLEEGAVLVERDLELSCSTVCILLELPGPWTRHATTQGDLALLVLSRGNKAVVHGSTAVEKCCIKAGNVQCALQMKRFFICVVKEEKYLQA